MIIKAGTYRFIDEPEVRSFAVNGSFAKISFISNTVEYDVLSSGSNDNVIGIIYFNNKTTDEVFAYSIDASSSSVIGWAEGCQTITVTTDTEVDDTFGTWFTKNTQMLIKAGSYKWNDELNIFNKTTGVNHFPLKFTVTANFTIDSENKQFNEGRQIFEFVELRFTSSVVGDFEYFTVDYFDSKDDFPYSVYMHYGGDHKGESKYWNYFSGIEGTNYKNPDLAKGFGQIITITEDTYVPTDFGLWATSNWKPYSKETNSPAVEITYKDKVITLNAGQTARLHNADGSAFGFEEDLVIKANGSSNCDGCIIEVEKLPTENIDTSAVYKYNGALYRYEKKGILGTWALNNTLTVFPYDYFAIGCIIYYWDEMTGEEYSPSAIGLGNSYDDWFGECLFSRVTDSSYKNLYYYNHSLGFSENSPKITFTEDTEDKAVRAWINENGEQTEAQYEWVKYIDESTVADIPLPPEISAEGEMTALLESAKVGSVYKYVGESTDTYENGGLYIVEAVSE